MTNKIPQEIEESLTAQNIYNEFELKAGIHIGTEERLIIQAIQKGFKAGQKQSEDAFKEMIEEAKSKVPKGSQTEAVLDVLEQELNSKEKKQDE